MGGMRFAGMVAAWLWLLASGALADAAASPDDQVARNLFNAGKVAYDAGDYQDALSFFEQAYERSKRPALLYNIGQAADRLRKDDKAVELFRAYLKQQPDAQNRVEVENRIRALERSRKHGSAAAPRHGEAPAADAPAKAAPTPEQTARAAQLPAPESTTPREQATSADEGVIDAGVTSQWWFWTALGAVVVGGVITAVALSSGDAADPALQAGDTGGVILTLGTSGTSGTRGWK